METAPGLDFWRRFAAMLALETSVIVLMAFALQTVVTSAVWRRTIWQGCALGVLTLLAVELSGGSRVFSGWMKTPQVTFANRAPEDRSFSVTVSEVLELPSARPSVLAPDRTQHSWWPGMLWLAGSALLIGRMLVIRVFFLLHTRCRRALNDLELLARVHELSVRLGMRRRVRVLEMRGLRGPIAFGMLKPTIGLPKDFSTFTAREQDAMLIHELAHLAGRDPVWYSLVDMLAALMWWHPLVWWIRRRLHRATEAAADEACVLVEDGPNILAEALVRLGSRLLERQRLGLLVSRVMVFVLTWGGVSSV
jgi:beta-lactamase regulating signal transducer with metallopeptidase domain